MKFKEFIKKFYDNPKKFLTNIAFVLALGVLLMLAGKTGLGILGISKDKSTVEKPKKEKTVETVDETLVSANSESIIKGSGYEERVKKDIEIALAQVNGVGKVSVTIYFEGSSESIPAINSVDSSKKTEEKDKEGGIRSITETNKNSTVVTTGESGKNKALIVKEIRPVIGGVMVVAEGAINSATKEEIVGAVKTLLNLPANRVFVSPMKKS